MLVSWRSKFIRGWDIEETGDKTSDMSPFTRISFYEVSFETTASERRNIAALSSQIIHPDAVQSLLSSLRYQRDVIREIVPVYRRTCFAKRSYKLKERASFVARREAWKWMFLILAAWLSCHDQNIILCTECFDKLLYLLLLRVCRFISSEYVTNFFKLIKAAST